jgi:hypothetical protein
VSKGCIRLYNQDVADLYPRVNVGAKVTVTWNKFTTTASASPTASPAASQGGGGGGGLFDLFADEDDEPVQKAPRKRTPRSKAAKSASVE